MKALQPCISLLGNYTEPQDPLHAEAQDGNCPCPPSRGLPSWVFVVGLGGTVGRRGGGPAKATALQKQLEVVMS